MNKTLKKLIEEVVEETLDEINAVSIGGGSLQPSGQVSGTGGNPLGRDMSDQHETMWAGDESEDGKIEEEFIGKKGGVSYFQVGGSLPDHLYNQTKDGKPTRDPGVAGLKRPKKKKNK